jgi:hypothetical protein
VTATELALMLADAIRRRAPKGEMLRYVRQFVMDCDAGDPTSLVENEPDTTGDERWDALIAGVVEDVAFRHRIPAPRWALNAPPLDTWWFVTDFERSHPTVFVETPATISRHGVFIRRASLVNV